MRIWIVQTGETMFTDGEHVRPMRAMNLASKALEEGHEVTIITSNFDHFSKSKRFVSDERVDISSKLSIFFIDSPGYSKNISPQRFLDHLILGIRMKTKCQKMQQPDVAFIGYPPIETSWFMVKLMKKKNIPYVLDVKDAWPTNIVDAFPGILQPLAKVLLAPYFGMFRYSVKNATKLCSISESFLKWAQLEGQRGPNQVDFVSNLTSKKITISDFDIDNARIWLNERVSLNPGRVTLYFIGSLSRSFDFTPLIQLAKEGKVNLIIGGDGEQFDQLKNVTSGLKNVFMLGWVNISQAQAISEVSDLALVPMKPLSDFELSIPNKFYDYMKFGKPILTSLKGDSRKLIEENEIGFFYSDRTDLESTIEKFQKDADLLKNLSKNCVKTYSEKYNFDIVYSNLLNQLINIKS